MSAQPPEVEDAPEDQGVPASTLRAMAGRPQADDALAEALRTGVLRRPGQGHIAGVCAALAASGGLPPRLVRLAALGLLGLGIGLPLYLAAALLLPRQRPPKPGQTREDAEIDVPLRSLLRGRPGRGDILVALALLPAVALALYWLSVFVVEEAAPLRLVIPLELVLLAVLMVGAVRARRARRAYLFAELAQRAGITDQAELEETVSALRAYAPRAWGRTDDETAAPDGDPARRPRAPARPLPRRTELVVIGVLLALACIAFTAVSVVPSLAPGLGDASPLPVIGRLGAASAIAALAAGALLIVIGVRGRRSAVVVTAGGLALCLLATSVIWVRVTDTRTGGELVLTVDQYEPGTTFSCADSGMVAWNMAIVLDLSHLKRPEGTSAQLSADWLADHPDETAQTTDLTMVVQCDRMVGDVRVILPPASSKLPVVPAMTTSFGKISGAVPAVDTHYSPRTPGVLIEGSLGTGSLEYRAAST